MKAVTSETPSPNSQDALCRPDGRISTPNFQFPTPKARFGERFFLGVGSWELGVS